MRFPSLRKRAPSKTADSGAVRQQPVKNAVGLDISDASVEATALRRGRSGQMVLSAYNRVELPEGVIRSGEVLNPVGLAESLRTLFQGAQPSPFPSRFVVFLLPESKVYLRTFEFPTTLSVAQALSAARFEAEGVLPLALEEVYADAVIHRSRRAHHHVLFAACPRRVVEAYLSVLEAAGLTPVAFEVESEALARSLVGYRDEPVIVADLGASVSTVSVVERGRVHGSVTIDAAGRAFTEIVEKTAHVSPEEAEVLKRSAGMTTEARPVVRTALQEALAPIVGEVRQMATAREKHTGHPVTELILAGGSALLPGLPEFLAERTGLPANLGDPLARLNITLPKELSAEGQEQFRSLRVLLAPSLGLAVRAGGPDPVAAGINILPPSTKRRYRLWRENLAISVFSLCTAVVLLAFAALFAGRTVLLRFHQQQLNGQSLVSLLGFSPRVTESIARVRSLNAEVDLLRQFVRQRGEALPAFQHFRGALGEGIHVSTVSIEAPPKPDGVTVTARGISDTRDAFLAFEQRLKELPGLTKMDSPLTNLDRPVSGTFSVTLTFQPPP